MPKQTLPTNADAVARATHAALLDVEAKARNALRATAAGAGSFDDPIVASREMGARIAPVILAARQVARRVGAQRMQDEVNATARGQRVVLSHEEHGVTAAADRLAAERASRDYSDALLREAQRILDNRDRASSLALASATDSALDEVSRNEVAQGFNDERRRLEQAAAREYDGTNWFPLLVKMWDATMDHTCPRCARLDGKLRPWGADFPGGLSPQVHRRCQCVILYVASPLFLGRSEAA